MRVDRTWYHDEFQPVDKKLNKSNSRKRYTSFFVVLFCFCFCLFVFVFWNSGPIYSVARQYNTINMLYDMSGYMYRENVNMNNIMKARDQGK